MTLPDIREVVPHSGRMVLLDRLVAFDGESLTAEVLIRAEALFADEHGVGAWIGVEYMAQAVAALAGIKARRDGGRARIGYLVGARHYTCNVPYFPLGAALRISVRRDGPGDLRLGSFACSITGAGIVADATVTVFQPETPDLSTDDVNA
ncbi:MAG: 3-hydroxylacyl-ACP dehydratase [Gemmatimonadaceae bacterium]